MGVTSAGLNARLRLEHRRQEGRNLFHVQKDGTKFLGKLKRPFHRNVRDGRLNLRNLLLVCFQIGLRNAGDAKPNLGMLQLGAALHGGAGAVLDSEGGLYGSEAGQLFGCADSALIGSCNGVHAFDVSAGGAVRQIELTFEGSAAVLVFELRRNLFCELCNSFERFARIVLRRDDGGYLRPYRHPHYSYAKMKGARALRRALFVQFRDTIRPPKHLGYGHSINL